jgi:hypothetical protein
MKIKNNAPGGRGFLGIEIPAGATMDVADDKVAFAQKEPGSATWFTDGTFTIVGKSDPAPKDAAK